MEVASYRFRSDASVELNADTGWAGPENSSADLHYDEPFRLRVQVKGTTDSLTSQSLGLQYRMKGEAWQAVGFSDFPYPSFATPVVSVISSHTYAHGEETIRLLGAVTDDWDEGAGLNGVAHTPVWRANNDAVEWEWPLVVRRFFDGPGFVADGSVIELRVVDGMGFPLANQTAMSVSLNARPGHLGGTFIETPGRLGPYQSPEGHLYFFMEPTETDNRFMAVKSEDFGKSWHEVDGENRPTADDLEGVGTVQSGSVIHIVHQVSREVFYHAFETNGSGRWLVDSESIATPDEPATQYADIVARSDGSLVAFYAGANRLFLQHRTPQGSWGQPEEIDSDVEPELSGPVLVAGPDDLITLAYTGRDGRGFIRHLQADGSLDARQTVSTRLGSDDDENGAILPLITHSESGTTVAVYRELDGTLYERRFSSVGILSDPVRISSLSVVTGAVDSEQAGADLVIHDSILHLIFIEESSRSIFYSRSEQPGIWEQPRLLIEGIEGSWLRGSVHLNSDGNPVYGFIYDAGSQGGAGFNRYHAIPL